MKIEIGACNRVGALTIEQNRLLEKLTKISGLLTHMGNELRYFGYPYLLVESVQSLALDMKKNDVTLTSSQTKLTKTKAILAEAAQALD